jgi:acetolactate synthase-1/2/3 large subunit
VKNYCDGGEAILEGFRALGVDHIISSPGSEWAPVWEALARQKTGNRPGPDFIDCWHETLAVDMALGYTQITGRMQAVLLHAGAGLLQGAVGIHAATLAEMPMLIMSGESLSFGENREFDPGSQWYRNLSIVGGPQRLVEPIVKWASQAASAYTLHDHVIRAGELAQRQPMGPTYLTAPVEAMLQQWTAPDRPRKAPPAPKTEAPAADIEKVAGLLIGAKNPVISTATAGRDPEAVAALVALADLLAIPVIEGRACAYANFPKDHPLHLGANIDTFLDDTDLVLAVSSRVPWYPPGNRPRKATVVAVDRNPLKGNMVYQNLQADLYLEGDVATSLRQLTEAVRAAGIRADKYDERRQRWRREHDKLRERQYAAEAAAQTKRPIDPLWLSGALRATMPPDAIYVDETVMHNNMLVDHLPWHEPQSYFCVHGGGLGQGLGVALGIKLAAPQRPVVALMGDGSFLYNPIIQALGASRGHKLPLLIVVFNNNKYRAMQQNHLDYYPDGAAASAGLFHGVHIDGPDYAELGRPFGFDGQKVEDPAELKSALANGLAAVRNGKTSILNVVLSQ